MSGLDTAKSVFETVFENKNYLASELPKTLFDVVLGNVIARSMGLKGVVGAGTGEGIVAGLHDATGYSKDGDGLTAKELTGSLATGLSTAGIGILGGKLLQNSYADIDSIGMTGFNKANFTQKVLGVPVNASEEFLQGGSNQVSQNWVRDEELDKDVIFSGSLESSMGLGQSALTFPVGLDIPQASKDLYDKTKQVIQEKTDPYNEVHSDISSDKYQPARVFDELTKQINNADDSTDVQDLIAKRDKLSVDLFNHWHTLKDSLDNETVVVKFN